MRCLTYDTNIPSNATGQYKSFNFNCMARFGDQIIGTSETGFYILGGATDPDAAEISAWLKTGMTDFGLLTSKRLRRVYLGLETDGDLELDIYADEVLVATRPIAALKSGGQQKVRVSVGRDAKGTHWAFALRNTKGVSFAIDSIQVLPVIRHHGHV